MNVVPPSSRRERLECRERLALDGDDGDVVAELARRAQDQKRKRAVAGDQADRARGAYSASDQIVDALATAAAESRRAWPR